MALGPAGAAIDYGSRHRANQEEDQVGDPEPEVQQQEEEPMAIEQPTSDDLFAKGVNGQITISGNWLTIHRKGFGRLGHSKGDRRIPLGSITAVQMRPAGTFANGFVKFTVPGSPEIRGGLNAATSDENAVIFKKKHRAEFDAVRDRIEAHIGRDNAPQAAPAAPDIPDQLKKLGELRDSGVLTDEEFEAKKTELLGRM